MEGQISKIEFSRGLLIKSPFQKLNNKLLEVKKQTAEY